MSDFEVGDRVCGKVLIQTQRYEVGDWVEGTLEDLGCDTNNQAGIRDDDDGKYKAVNRDSLELTSKGSESDMQEVDAIAVEVDNEELGKAIQKEAFNYGWKWGEETIWDENEVRPREVGDGLGFHKKTKKLDGSSQEYWDDDQFLGKISENWNKVVDFIKQEQPLPTINDHEAKIDGQIIKVGCWEGNYSDLVNFYKLCKTIGITSGKLVVSGETIDITELYNFIQELREVK